MQHFALEPPRFFGGGRKKNGVKMRRVETRLTAFYHAALIIHAKSHVQCQVARFEWRLGSDADQSSGQQREEHVKNKIFSRNNLMGVEGVYCIIISAANFSTRIRW